jgi:hypothetical protein
MIHAFLPLLFALGTLPLSEDYFPLKPGMKWSFETLEGKIEVKSVGELKKIGDREYRLIRNAFVGTPPDRDVPALVSENGVALFDEHDQVDMVWLKLPATCGQEWTHKASTGSVALKIAGEEQIEVPHGKYRALKVVAQMDVQGAKGSLTIWYAKGVGEVKSELNLKINNQDRKWSRALKTLELPPVD